MKIEVMDIETLSNCFTCTYVNLQSKAVTQFVIHSTRNDYPEFVDFSRSLEGMIGFNNIDFDYAVLHPFLVENYCNYDGDTLAKEIYKRAQEVISWQDRTKKVKKDWITPIVPQRDLFRIWHFNNMARSTSLKYLQINMHSENVQEMPIHHTATVEAKDIPVILQYNLNDVTATLDFYNLSKNKIKLRKTLTETYDTDFSNYSDNKIGEQIFVKELVKKTGRSQKDIMAGRTFRKNIAGRDCVIDGINFTTPGFQMIYNEFQKLTITSTKKDKKKKKEDDELFSVIFDGVKYGFGFGGIHAFRESGVYSNITSADVSSYYPNLSIGSNFYPQHLGQSFCVVYKHLYEERKKYDKKSDENAAYKLALNGTFGQSNAEWSPFYDPKFTMSITITGQLLLALLCERLTEGGAGSIIMANTDGIEIDVRNESKFKAICKEWQQQFNVDLEYNEYKTLVCRDVNNYTAMTNSGQTKEKGVFDTNREIYKNQSMKIVGIAVREYFHNNIPVEQTINNCTDLKMFLIGKRAKTGDLRYHGFKDGIYFDKELPKNVRYYISSIGGSIVKSLKTTKKSKDKTVSPDQMAMFDINKEATQTVEKIVNLHVGYRMNLFNKWITKPFNQYQIDKSFYLREATKLINSVTTKQTTI